MAHKILSQTEVDKMLFPEETCKPDNRYWEKMIKDNPVPLWIKREPSKDPIDFKQEYLGSWERDISTEDQESRRDSVDFGSSIQSAAGINVPSQERSIET